MAHLVFIFAIFALTCLGAVAQKPAANSAPDDPGACIAAAASFHRVNAQILEAILQVESGLQPRAVGKNVNGTLDVGIGQINSTHFQELGRFGIAPQDLKLACVGTYVSAWHLSKQYQRYGNTWFAVGAYHSLTAEHNLRYQHLIYARLAKSRTPTTQ